MWMYKGFSGELFAKGKTLSKVVDHKHVVGDMIKFDLDHGAHTISMSVNGVSKGVVFEDIPSTMIYPAVSFYGKDRAAKIVEFTLVESTAPVKVKPSASSAGVYRAPTAQPSIPSLPSAGISSAPTAQPSIPSLPSAGISNGLTKVSLDLLSAYIEASGPEAREMAKRPPMESFSKKTMKLLNLSREWIHQLLPHVLGKVNRVKFGLLSAADLENCDSNMSEARKVLAVPFVGKDVPTAAAEFAMPEVRDRLSECIIDFRLILYHCCLIEILGVNWLVGDVLPSGGLAQIRPTFDHQSVETRSDARSRANR
jgi:hypothetical protein